MDPTLFAKTETLVREIVTKFTVLHSVDTEEQRKELIKLLNTLAHQLTPPDNTPRPPSCANYII